MTIRRVALVGGSLAFGIGLATIVAPGLLPVSLDQAVVLGLGLLVIVQAFRVVYRRWHTDRTEADTPDPERLGATPAPGEALDGVLEQFLGARQSHYRRTRIREGLHSAAVAVLTRYGGYAESEAEDAIAAGTWTDDVYAAAFLGGEEAPMPPIRTRLGLVVRRGSVVRMEGIRHTVDEIAAIAGVGTGNEPDQNTQSLTNRETDASTSDSSTATVADIELEDERGVIAGEPRSTGHWRGVSAVALFGIGVGVLVEQPAVLLAGVVGIGFAAYARSSALLPGSVSIDRTLSDDAPDPGDDVEVTVTVTNESDRFLPDLRFVDGVPDGLAVTDGTPRLGTALRSGECATVTYTVTARRGQHEFEPATLVARDLPGSVEQERSLAVETTLTCVPPLRPLAGPVRLRNQATQYAGRVATQSGGEGVEFHATREYRQGDPMSRIDWNRRARTGDLTTVQFREERAATVVIVIDARKKSYLSPAPHAPHTVDRTVAAARKLFTTLTESGDRVGITALSSEPCWLPPDTGTEHSVEAQRLLATHPALTPAPTESHTTMVRWQERLRKRLSPGTQVLFLTPLCDEYSGHFARRLDEYGHPVTVLSPDPTADLTPSHRLASVARALRISSLRAREIQVIDWPWDESVDALLAQHERSG